MTKNQVFRALINGNEPLILPAAHDVLSAKIIEDAGFDALTTSGFGIAASLLGMPDVGLLTMPEMVDVLRNMANATTIPILADGDEGFGSERNVARTVREFEDAGVSGINIEDQVFPKQCGHTKGKQVVPLETFLAKLKTAINSKRDLNFVVLARIDSLAVNGIHDAIHRAKEAARVGADVIFIEAPPSAEDLKLIGESIKNKPLLVNRLEGGKTPPLSTNELFQMGFKLQVFPLTTILATHFAVTKAVDNLKSGNVKNELTSFENFREFVGFPEGGVQHAKK